MFAKKEKKEKIKKLQETDHKIDIRMLNKSYQMGEQSLHVLKDINFTVDEGEFVAILGPSGSGKSTLMKILSGAYPFRDYEGEITLEGKICTFSGPADAENAGISRQGVRDVIVRAEAAMQEVEDKTGIIKRFEAQRPHLDAIESAAAEVQTINYRQYDNPRLTELVELIHTETAALKD